jgi:hypothetical protein
VPAGGTRRRDLGRDLVFRHWRRTRGFQRGRDRQKPVKRRQAARLHRNEVGEILDLGPLFRL